MKDPAVNSGVSRIVLFTCQGASGRRNSGPGGCGEGPASLLSENHIGLLAFVKLSTNHAGYTRRAPNSAAFLEF